MEKTDKTNSIHRILPSILAILSLVLIILGVTRLYRLYTNLAHKDESIAQASLRDKRQHSVLFLSSYSQSHFSVPLQWDGLSAAFEGTDIVLDTEYMDMKNSSDPDTQAIFEDLLRKKLETHSYEVLVVGDDAALNFAEEHLDDLFKDTPVVFLGINDLEHAARAHDEGWATGVPEQSNMADVFETSARLFSGCDTFVSIIDDTETGKADVVSLEQIKPQFPDHTFDFINLSHLTHDEFLDAIGSLPDNTIVFELDAFKDAEGNVYTIDDVCRLLSEHCPRPVFRVSTGGVGNGALCSGFLDFEMFGRVAGAMVIDLLNGAKPSEIPLATGNSTEYMFDYQQLKRFGIKDTQLPENSIVLGQDNSLLENYNAVLQPISYILMGFACLTLFLVLESVRARRDERALHQRHYHDELTNLPNRNAVEDLHNRRPVHSLGVIDIDGFRFINESYGYRRGDIVLKTMADRLRSIDEMRVARSGADEFLLLYEGDISKDYALHRRIRELCHTPVETDEGPIEISCSSGIAVRNENQSLHELMAEADLALYQAKQAGDRSNNAYFTPQMLDKIHARRQIVSALVRAIEEESFEVVYQPQIDLETEALHGFEALCRFKDNEYFPNQFIPVAESAGLILQVDRIVTKKAIGQLKAWKDAGYVVPVMSINYSSTQLKDSEYGIWLKGLLDEAGIAPDRVKLEVTESGSFDGKAAQQFFQEVHEMGMSLALDDYGTGYSTLSAVSDFPMDYIKLDKSVNDIHLQPGKEHYLESLVSFIHGLGKRIVAEGVETEEQIQLAKGLEIDQIQGYYYSRPLPAKDAESWLKK